MRLEPKISWIKNCNYSICINHIGGDVEEEASTSKYRRLSRSQTSIGEPEKGREQTDEEDDDHEYEWNSDFYCFGAEPTLILMLVLSLISFKRII